MSKAGERAMIQYLGMIAGTLTGILGTMTKDFPGVNQELIHVLEVWEDYEKSSKEV